MKHMSFIILMVIVLALSVVSFADGDAELAEDTVSSAVLGVVCPASAQPVTTTTDIITMERAKEIALADARLAETDVTFVKTELDIDDDRQEYEIEFYSGSTEYEYDIDATTGTIVSSNVEPIYDD